MERVRPVSPPTRWSPDAEEYLRLAAADSHRCGRGFAADGEAFAAEMVAMRRRLERLTRLILDWEERAAPRRPEPPRYTPLLLTDRLQGFMRNEAAASPRALRAASPARELKYDLLRDFELREAPRDAPHPTSILPPQGLFRSSPNKPRFLHVEQLLD